MLHDLLHVIKPKFSVAEETLALMQQLADSGELEALTPERVWKETSRALMEDHADEYFEVLRRCGALKVLFQKSRHFTVFHSALSITLKLTVVFIP